MTFSSAVPPGEISSVLSLVPLIARSCGILPSFFASKVISPAFRLVDPSVILNSTSLTGTFVAAGFAGAVVVACVDV